MNTENNDNSIFEGLNPAQKGAVETINGPVLIVAGAGSGKTRVITNRIAYLISQGISPRNILALTFTNKAAQEMKNRIAKLVEPHLADIIWAGTFHSVFAKLLRYDASNIGYDSNFTIYDTEDSLSLVKKIFAELSLGNDLFTPQAIRSKISSMKNKLITWQQIFDSPKDRYDKIFAEIYQKYNDRLRTNNAMDFDDLLVNFITLLKNSPDTLHKYQERFKYILVDEYQDTNHSQYLAVNMLSNRYRNVCVVGDDAQSIYGWRGAEIQNILDFKKDYHEAKVFKLEENYRSTQNILSAADEVIKHNKKQLQKTLTTANPKGELIKLVECDSDMEEADYIISRIKSMVNKGNSIKDFAVLYRTNAQSLQFEKACRRLKLPYVIIGGMSFYKRKEVKDVMSYLRLLVNPRDSEALLRIVNEPTRGLGQTSLQHIMNYAQIYHIDLLTAFRQVEDNANLQSRAVKAAKTFADFIDYYRENLEPGNYSDLISEYILNTGLINFYEQLGTDEGKDRVRNIEQVVNDISSFAKDNPESSLDDYIQQISLISDVDDKEFGAERLPLMTIHSAKGLEFKEVFIAGMEKGLFPLERSMEDQKQLEEERRLFYVGITRAEQLLHITYANRRLKFGQIMGQVPSPFIREISDDLFDFCSPNGTAKSRNNKPTFASNSKFAASKDHYFSDIPQQENYSQIPETRQDYSIGVLVRHKQFGVGKISGLSGYGDNRKATVNFSNIGKKILLLKYAKLELVKQSR